VAKIAAERKDSRGVVWVKLANGKGWISTDVAKKYTSFKSYKAKITANTLTIRKSADIDSKAVGYLKKDNTVTIVQETKTSDGRTWGKLSDGRGWISLKFYVLLASIHAAACLGDFYYFYLILVKFGKGKILVEDTPVGMSIYQG
jgi:hypothetical protein